MQQASRKDFYCENNRFSTNIKKGFSHGDFSKTKGSVFPKPLIEANEYTLWLEYVIDKDENDNIFWLMWYDDKGHPTMPMSAVFNKNDLANMISQLANFIP